MAVVKVRWTFIFAAVSSASERLLRCRRALLVRMPGALLARTPSPPVLLRLWPPRGGAVRPLVPTPPPPRRLTPRAAPALLLALAPKRFTPFRAPNTPAAARANGQRVPPADRRAGPGRAR
eukprot:scaffold1269_cov400-Prasinococcus_capsulatus_cf.AAC.1